jgi:hypothetical protein
MIQAIQYARQRQTDSLSELLDFLRIPSVSTEPAHDADTAAAAAWLAWSMEAAGLESVRLIETERHPLVYADWLRAGPAAPTVLIYGHYDVQPADPLDKWLFPPFQPEVRDEYVYARGAADDKGQVYIHVKAVGLGCGRSAGCRSTSSSSSRAKKRSAARACTALSRPGATCWRPTRRSSPTRPCSAPTSRRWSMGCAATATCFST